MEAEIRGLFIKYGIAEVKECMEKECRRMYESLQSIYEVKRKYERKASAKEPVPTAPVEEPVAPTAPIEQPVEEPVAPTEPLKKHIRKVKVIKSEDVKEPESNEDNETKENIFEIIKKSNKFIPAPVSVESESDEEHVYDKVVDEKERHRIAVEEKRKELLEQGIEPESLLTKENLEVWLKKGKTYMKIAKETGVDEGEVSRTARGFGLKSVMTKHKFLRIPRKFQK